MKIQRLKSMHPISPYAPTWDIPIGTVNWGAEESINSVKNFLLKKEKDILELDIMGDGGTGLPPTSVTTRFGKYNLFDFIDECKGIKELLKFMQLSYLEFVNLDYTDVFPLEIVSWYNIIYKGQSFNWHNHGRGEIAYLSGNMHLDNYPTSGTTYKKEDMIYTIPNVKGGLTIFPTHLSHKVDTYEDDNPRVSIAFDLYIYKPPYHMSNGQKKSLPFMNSNIYQSLMEENSG